VASFDPHNGRLNWSDPHTTDVGLKVSMPVWSAANRVLVVSSAYNGGTRGLTLDNQDVPTGGRERGSPAVYACTSERCCSSTTWSSGRAATSAPHR
jgi:hypothetical protein